MKKPLSLWILALGGLMSLAAIGASPALATHPPYECTQAREGEVKVMPDGEAWMCRKTTQFGSPQWFWDMLSPGIRPWDSVSYKRVVLPRTANDQFMITSRSEWINDIYLTGADVYELDAVGNRIIRPAGTFSHKTRLIAYDATTSAWIVCRDAPWTGTNTVPTHGVVTTWNWGGAPCGSKWYYSIAYAGTWANGVFSWITANTGVTTEGAGHVTFGGTLASGQPATNSSGFIFDPKPGDNTTPPKTPKKPKDSELIVPPPSSPFALGGLTLGSSAAVLS